MGAPRVTVVGAGIVGVCAASWLQREGFAVTVIEPDPGGQNPSFGNAGNISPGAVVPFAIPGILRQAPKWLLDPKGPLAIRPLYFPRVLPWLLAAVRASQAEASLAVSRAMRELHRGTFEAYEVLTRDTAAAALIERCGQLYVSGKPGVAQGSELTRFMREAAGVRAIALGEGEIRDLEPALAPIFRSGLLLPDNGRCRDPGALVRILLQEAARRGATLVSGKVEGFITQGGGVQAVIVDGSPQSVERVVVAAGIGSRALAAQLGSDLPLEAERGYHITIADPGLTLRRPVTNRDGYFACAPMNTGLRLAGTVEFAGLAAPPDWRRALLLREQAARMFPGVNLASVAQWSGARPSFPDSLPVLDRAPRCDNAWFAFGNSHFGLTAGPVMGRTVAELVAGRKPAIDTTAFRAGRFAAT